MLKSMIPVMFSASFVIPIADGVPTLSYEAGCRDAARQDPLKQITAETCMAQERAAREELAKDWGTFTAADRTHCGGLVNIGGTPSYVELLVCMQMSRDARQMRRENPQTHGLRIPDIGRDER